MSLLQIIGGNIKRLRLSCGFSQEKLADITGLHRTYVGAVERGERNVSILNVERIADALGVLAFELLKNSDDSQ